MRKILFAVCAVFLSGLGAFGQSFNEFPYVYSWTGDNEVAFYHENPASDYVIDARTRRRSAPKAVESGRAESNAPLLIDGAENFTLSPDASMGAFTRGGDLWLYDMATGNERRLTSDGSDLILNGYASWVYYEEILGRSSRYKAFWWSPDSKKIGFYRFDNTEVPLFPIYSARPEGSAESWMSFGYTANAGGAKSLEGMSPIGGSVRLTRYPLCGDPNPKVRVGIADVIGGGIAWADFDENEDQYFGTPFWGADSEGFFVQREPRRQNELDLYSVNPADGSKTRIYHESYDTWLDWIDGMYFGRKGLYMVRSFETLWQQIYYLSYDGKTFRRLTDGDNWRVSVLDVKEGKPSGDFDGSTSEVIFSAERDSRSASGLYKAKGGEISAISTPGNNVSGVRLSPGKDYAVATESRSRVPDQIWLYDLRKPSKSFKVADLAGPDFNSSDFVLGELISITTEDGFELPGLLVLPKDFDPSVKYPVHVSIYGGPDSPQVRDCWRGVSYYDWYSSNGIIELVADCRASGHNGRAGLDQIYRRLDKLEVRDFVEWADYLKSLPYVNGDKIGVEGFSFGGTMTALLVMDHSDAFHYGIAGGGVYDWALYDTHYTERFMDTPMANPEGYAETKATASAKNYPVTYDNYDGSVMLRLTHGTGDDNVHFQSTLQLVDALEKAGKKFDLMIYPDGMHGYHGYQGQHSTAANREFWLRYLCGK